MVEELQAAVDLATTEERLQRGRRDRQAEIHESVKALDNKIAKAEETEEILLRNAGAAVGASEAKEKAEVREASQSQRPSATS